MPEPLDEERRRRLIEKLERLKQPGGGESPVATLEQPAPTQGAGQPTAQPTAKLPPALSRQEHLLREVSLLNRVLYDETTGRIRPELAEVARAGHGQFAPEVLDAFMTRVPAYRDLSSQERQQFLQSRWAQRRMVGALPPEVVDYDSLAFKVWRVLPAWGRWVLRFLLARSSSWGCLSKPVRD